MYFGTLFNDINITRQNANGVIIDSIRVPLTYAPKDKMLARVNADPNLTKETAITLPRMSFEYHDYTYDGSRKLNTLGVHSKKSDDVNKFLKQYTPVAVNLRFSLYVYVKNAEDGTKIIEQILPFFRPDWTAKIQIIDDMNLVFDVPIVIGTATSEDKYDGSFLDRRALIWTIPFTLKGFLFGPIKKTPIIKFANTRFFTGTPLDHSDVISQTTVTPGLLANGEPTTNASLSISPLLIDVDDNWDYVVQQSGLILSE